MLGSLYLLLSSSSTGDAVSARALWEVVLVVLGAISTTGAAVLIVWKVAKPHVEGYLRRLIGPIAADVAEVRREVRPADGGTLKDHAVQAAEAAVLADGKLDRLARAVGRNTAGMRDIGERVDLLSEVLDEHLSDADRALEALGDQGISLPRPGTRLPRPGRRQE